MAPRSRQSLDELARMFRGGGAAEEPAGLDVSQLSGPGLQQAGIDLFNPQHAADVAQHRQIQQAAGDPHADIAAADEDIMGSSTRSPGWAAFFGLQRGKRMSGFGQPGFEVGRQNPGAPDVVESTSRTYRPEEFEDSPLDRTSATGFGAGSMANRSGLSVAALRQLAQGLGGR